MILGIDASNIRSGGGVTHLVELLRAATPSNHGFARVIVWSGSATLAVIEERDWLLKVHDPLLDRGFPYWVFWQRFRLKDLAQRASCDVLFVPGGTNANSFKPMVAMSQNLLPFEWREMLRYGWSFYTLKFLLLRWSQSHSFRKADGVIFLTEYARNVVSNVIGKQRGVSTIIPHGIHPRFLLPPRSQRPSSEFQSANPWLVLYVSVVSPYKHQWQVVEAVAQLRSAGVPVVLKLVGPPEEGMNRLRSAIKRFDPDGNFIIYCGTVGYDDLDKIYAAADIGLFASSCENMPNILLEGMAAGLPMACSKMGPMPEVLGYAGIYFDPENPAEIAQAIRQLIDSPELRAIKAQAGFDLAGQYSWKRCADRTFAFLAHISQADFNENVEPSF